MPCGCGGRLDGEALSFLATVLEGESVEVLHSSISINVAVTMISFSAALS